MYNNMTAQDLSQSETKLITLVREIKKTGFGEVIVLIQDGKIKIVKHTTIVKI